MRMICSGELRTRSMRGPPAPSDEHDSINIWSAPGCRSPPRCFWARMTDGLSVTLNTVSPRICLGDLGTRANVSPRSRAHGYIESASRRGGQQADQVKRPHLYVQKLMIADKSVVGLCHRGWGVSTSRVRIVLVGRTGWVIRRVTTGRGRYGERDYVRKAATKARAWSGRKDRIRRSFVDGHRP